MNTEREIDVQGLVKALKERLGTTRRIATAVGVSEKSVNGWEKANSKIRQDHRDDLVRLARDQGIDPGMYLVSPELWDFRKSYLDNLSLIPPLPSTNSHWQKNRQQEFLGRQINSPFGASASVLTSSSDRISFLARTGCDVIVYKTVRSRSYPSHPMPNVFFATSDFLTKEGRIPDSIEVTENPDRFSPAAGMMNRYGMPCPGPEVWQADFAAAKRSMNPNQLLILSVVGTAPVDDGKKSGTVEKELLGDFVRVVGLAKEAGAEVVELNLSCPNCSGVEGSLSDNVLLVQKICRAVRDAAPDIQLLLKLAYMSKAKLKEIVLATAPFVQGYSGINTIPVEGKRRGQHVLEPAYGLPGLKAGLSGGPILSFGLEFVKNLDAIRKENSISFGIIGCGGVTEAANVQQYLKNGADVVQGTTAFFANSFFGLDVQSSLSSMLRNHEVRLVDELTLGWRNWYQARAKT